MFHQRNFMRVLHHAAAGADRCAADKLCTRQRRGHTICEHKSRRLLDADCRRCQPTRPKTLCDQRVRILILVPCVHLRVGTERTFVRLLHRAPLFKLWCDEERTAFHGNHGGQQSLAHAPPDAGEILHRRAARQHQRIDFGFAHQAFRLLDAGASFVNRNRRHTCRHGTQRANRGGHRM